MQNDFTNYIKVLRYKNQVPIRRLSKLTGYPMKYILELEAGKVAPTEEFIEKLIFAYDLDSNQQRILYNFAAKATNSLPFDVVRFLLNNPIEVTKIINTMHIANEQENNKSR